MNIFDLQATLRLDTSEFRRETEAAGQLFRSLGEEIAGAAESMASRAEGMAAAFSSFGMLGGLLGDGGLSELIARTAEGIGALFAPFAEGEGLSERIAGAAGGFGLFTSVLAEAAPAAEKMTAAENAFSDALSATAGNILNVAANAGNLGGLYGALSAQTAAWAGETGARWAEAAGSASGSGSQIAGILTGTIPAAVGVMLGAFGSLPGQFSEIGARMASGLEGGFSSIWSGVASAVKAKVGGLVESVKGLLGINSPSRVFSEIGENMAKGLESGWASGFVSAGRTVEEGMDFSARASRYGGSGSAAVNRIGFGDSALGRSSAAGIAAMANPALGRAGSEPVEINLILDGDRAASVLYDPLRRAAFRRGGEEILA